MLRDWIPKPSDVFPVNPNRSNVVVNRNNLERLCCNQPQFLADCNYKHNETSMSILWSFWGARTLSSQIKPELRNIIHRAFNIISSHWRNASSLQGVSFLVSQFCQKRDTATLTCFSYKINVSCRQYKRFEKPLYKALWKKLHAIVQLCNNKQIDKTLCGQPQYDNHY